MELDLFLRKCCGLGLCLFLLSSPGPILAAAPKESPDLARDVTPRQIYQQAEASYARFDSYIARFVQRNLAKQEKQEEILTFHFRKHPWSVRFKWLAGEGQGREVLYVPGKYENKIHVILAPFDVPFLPAGHLLSLDPNSPMVKRASSTPITEAGIGPMIQRFGKVLDASDRGDYSQGRLTVRGSQRRPDYDGPLVMVEQSLPPRAEEQVPRGGSRLIGFHPELHLPVLEVLRDETGQEIDYYRFDRLQLGVHLGDADFDPQRMARRYQPKKQ